MGTNWVVASHIPGVQNEEADFESRKNETRLEWKLNENIVDDIFCSLESIICLDEDTNTKQNFTAHDSVGGSWTDKVLNTKDEKGAHAHLTKESEGVEDDEWVK